MKNDISLLNIFVMIRRLVYLTLVVTDRLIGRTNPLVILCYHSISDDNWRFSVGPKEFKKQILYMIKHYNPVTLSDVYKYLIGAKSLHEPSFAITFDDGYKNVITVKKFLSELSIKPTVFVLGASGNTINWKSLGKKNKLLSKNDIEDLRKSGWEIGYHGLTHTILTRLNGSLKEEIFSQYNYFAYPKGRYSKRIISSLRKTNYKLAMSMDDSIISRGTNPYRIPRIGVDRTHNYLEFQTLSSPSVVQFRKLIKGSFLGRYL